MNQFVYYISMLGNYLGATHSISKFYHSFRAGGGVDSDVQVPRGGWQGALSQKTLSQPSTRTQCQLVITSAPERGVLVVDTSILASSTARILNTVAGNVPVQ